MKTEPSNVTIDDLEATLSASVREILDADCKSHCGDRPHTKRCMKVIFLELIAELEKLRVRIESRRGHAR